MRELTDKERKIAHKLGLAIATLDELVFPENPISKIEIIKMWPQEERRKGCIHYLPKKEVIKYGEVEHYMIYGCGIDREIFVIKRDMRHIVAGEKKYKKDTFRERRLEDWDSLPRLTEDELFLGIAVHEVRHRIQYSLPIKLFAPEVDEKIDCPDLELIIEYLTECREMKQLILGTSFDEKEFDAAVVECWVRKVWHEVSGEVSESEIHQVIERIAQAVVIEPKYFTKAEE